MKRFFYSSLLITILFAFIFAQDSSAQSSASKRTRVGNPPITEACWPTNGPLTQGPLGPVGHGAGFTSGKTGASVDIGPKEGEPVYATFNGTVSIVDLTNKGEVDATYGNLVKLSPDDHPGALIYHAHLLEIKVTEGQRVSVGDLIGLVGGTGGYIPHLHYEFRGLELAPPNIPEPIIPGTCNGDDCTPREVSAHACTVTTNDQKYWFMLHRKSLKEMLYLGTPGDVSQSTLVKTFTVRTGHPSKRPTPLPQLAGEEYWEITSKGARSGSVGPYFLVLNIPYQNAFGGPLSYTECDGQQCNWGEGDFGLHGTGGDPTRVNNDGDLAINDNWSSGCIRHIDSDIEYLYNTLSPTEADPIRYYVEDI